jgi:hypothetical protein
MPDLHLTIEELIAEADKVVWRKPVALDGSRIWQEDWFSWLRALALRGRQDRRALGNGDAARRALLVGLIER